MPRALQPDLFDPMLDVRGAGGLLSTFDASLSALTTETSDLASISDAKVLERLLARSGVTKARSFADAVLRRFDSLSRALPAEPPALSAIVGAEAALDLRLIHEAARRFAAADLTGRCLVASQRALAQYLKLTMAHREREAFRVLFLDDNNQLVADEILGHGTVDHAPVYPREVIRRALELAAPALILVHNHPSGDPTPSAADIDMTRQVIAAAKVFAIVVHDHIVVGRTELASFRALGLV
jgi:DNA repair protein RadC